MSIVIVGGVGVGVVVMVVGRGMVVILMLVVWSGWWRLCFIIGSRARFPGSKK